MTPKVSEEHKQARREQIINAAIDCFIRNGIHKTSMRDICQESGLSVGAVYLHFKSKEEIIEASWKMSQETSRARYEEGVQIGSARGTIKSWGEEYDARLRHPDKARQLYPQLLAEAFRNPRIRENIVQAWREVEQAIEEATRQGIAEGLVKSDADARLVGRLWSIVQEGAIIERLIDPQRDVVEVVRFYRMLLQDHIFVGGPKINTQSDMQGS